MLFALLGGRVDCPTPATATQGGDGHPAPVQHVEAHPHYWKPHEPVTQTDPNSHNSHPHAFGHPPPIHSHGEGTLSTDPHFDPESMSAMELWNRLQNFYEPAQADWTQMPIAPYDGSAMGVGLAMGMGSMDGMVGGVF